MHMHKCLEIEYVVGNSLKVLSSNGIDYEPCYIELRCDEGILHVGYPGYSSIYVQKGIPRDVFMGYWKRWYLSSYHSLKGKNLNSLLDKIASYAQKVLDGYSLVLENDYHVVTYTKDALEACEAIERICNQA